MLRGVAGVVALFAWSVPSATTAQSPEAAEDVADAPPDPPPGAVVVVVESARRSVGPQAIRRALSDRLEGAEVRGLNRRDERPRAWVVVAVHRDGSADLRVVSSNGNEDSTHVLAPEGELTPALAIAERIRQLLGEAEEDPPIGSVARHGLIPWEEEELRPYPQPGFHRIDGEALLPWPQGEAAEGRRSRRGTRPEPAAGLTAPTPRQNR